MPGGKHGARAIAEDDYDDYYDDEEDYYNDDDESEQDVRNAESQVSKPTQKNTEQSAQPQKSSQLDQDEEELNILLAQLIPDLKQTRSSSSNQAHLCCHSRILLLAVPMIAAHSVGEYLNCKRRAFVWQ